jgi:hypothetical protein
MVRVNNFCTHKHSISCIVHDIPKDFSWKLVVVYGLAYEDKKVEFIDELHSMMSGWQGPVLVGSDFNLCRTAVDKSNNRVSQKFVDYFNDWINRWVLIELNPLNRKFTWTNN